MKTINLKQLAEELKLSTATVSRALNGHVSISQATQKRVRALASERHYTPNFCASGLRRAKTQTIGVIIPAAELQRFAAAIDGVEKVARQHKCHVLLHLSREDEEREKAMLQLLTGGLVDGLLLGAASSSPHPVHLALLRDQELPVVLLTSPATEQQIAVYQCACSMAAAVVPNATSGEVAANLLFQQIQFPVPLSYLPTGYRKA